MGDHVHLGGQALKPANDLLVAGGGLPLIMFPGGQRLPQGEEVFGAPVAAQTFGERVAVGANASVLEFGQDHRIAFTGRGSLAGGTAT